MTQNLEVMKMKKLMMTGLTLAMLSAGAASAATVTGYTAPVAGEAATAASVDDNFQALITAIDDNAARIADLESFDVAGKTYEFRNIGFIMGAERLASADPGASPGSATSLFQGFVRLGIFNTTGTITFNADGTNMAIDITEFETEMFVNPESDIGPGPDFDGGAAASFATNGTYTQNGAVVSVTLLDPQTQAAVDQFTAIVSKGANVFTITNQGTDQGSTTQVQDPTQCRTVNQVDYCIQDWETSFGIGTRSN